MKDLLKDWSRHVGSQPLKETDSVLLKTEGLRFLIVNAFVDHRDERRAFLENLTHHFNTDFFTGWDGVVPNLSFFFWLFDHPRLEGIIEHRVPLCEFVSSSCPWQGNGWPTHRTPYILFNIRTYFKKPLQEQPPRAQWQQAFPEVWTDLSIEGSCVGAPLGNREPIVLLPGRVINQNRRDANQQYRVIGSLDVVREFLRSRQ